MKVITPTISILLCKTKDHLEVEYEQRGTERAEYGSVYQKWQALPAKLSWTHFVTLPGVSDETARKFYEQAAVHFLCPAESIPYPYHKNKASAT